MVRDLRRAGTGLEGRIRLECSLRNLLGVVAVIIVFDHLRRLKVGVSLLAVHQRIEADINGLIPAVEVVSNNPQVYEPAQQVH